MSVRAPLALALLVAGLPAAASAQQPAPQPAAQPLGGPAIAGVCLLSREAIFTNAIVGKAASARLQEIARTAQAEVEADRKPIETEAKALEAQPASAQTQQRRTALQTRIQALQQKAALINREVEATRAKALERLATEAQPIIAQAYTARKCGLLLDRNVLLGGNFANDLTADVVKGLDAKIQTITFERERLPQAAPAR